MSSVLYVGNTSLIAINGLNTDGTYENDATVELTTIVDPDGAQITGETFPVSMAYVAASDGNYEGELSNAAVIAQGTSYTLTIVATSAAGKVAKWNETLVAKMREV